MVQSSMVVAESKMGKKSWFSVMKKAISPSFSKIRKEKRSHKSKSNLKNSWHKKQMSLDTFSTQPEAALANPFPQNHPINENEFQLPENEQIKHVDFVTYNTTIVEDAESSCDAAAQLNCTTSIPCFAPEEISAIKIQTAYRGYTARRALRTLRAKMRLHMCIQRQAVKPQTTSTLTRIQNTSRVQSQVQVRKIQKVEVNKALQQQLIQKCQKVLEKDFDLSPKSKEQRDAQLQNRKEATERREKALAYAFSRQQAWRNSQKRACQVVMVPNHLQYGIRTGSAVGLAMKRPLVTGPRSIAVM